MTFTPNLEAQNRGGVSASACSVSASLQKDKDWLQVKGDNSGAEHWKVLQKSMVDAGLTPAPVLSPRIFFTRDKDGIPSLDVSKMTKISTYLIVTMTLRAPEGGV